MKRHRVQSGFGSSRFERLGLVLLSASLLVVAGISQAQSSADPPYMDPAAVDELLLAPQEDLFVPGEVLVKLKPGAPDPQVFASGVGMEPQIRETSGGVLVLSLDQSGIGAMSDEDVRKRTLAAVQSLRADDRVEYAQPNYIYQIHVDPNDTRYGEQWHYFENGNGPGQSPGGIGLPDVWDTNQGNANVVVAVLDTGILPNHADITGSPNLVAGFDMITDTFRANDGGGRDNDPTDPGDAVAAGVCCPWCGARNNSWHGTHVSGTVGVGNTNNGVGVAGVNWAVSVQAVRVLGRCGGTDADIADAIRWAAGLNVPGVPNNATPADIINMSLGGQRACTQTPVYQAAINDAVNAGTTVVVSAGNSALDASGFTPASCNNVITVAASEARGRLATRYSNFGATVEIMAPGGDVQRDDDNDGNPDGVLSMIQGGYSYYNGTSMAAPHVSGVAALMLAQQPNLTPGQILTTLQGEAKPRNATECPQPCGAGLLDASFLVPPGVDVSLSIGNNAAIDVGDSTTASASVTRRGVVMPGVLVRFSSADTGIATVGASANTNAQGIATVQVQGVAQGNTTITAASQGASDPKMVTVNSAPGLPNWALLLAILFAVLLLYVILRRTTGSP